MQAGAKKNSEKVHFAIFLSIAGFLCFALWFYFPTCSTFLLGTLIALQLWPVFRRISSGTLDFLAFALLGEFAAFSFPILSELFLAPSPRISKDAVLEIQVLLPCTLAVILAYRFAREWLPRLIGRKWMIAKLRPQLIQLNAGQSVSIALFLIVSSHFRPPSPSFASAVVRAQFMLTGLLFFSEVPRRRWVHTLGMGAVLLNAFFLCVRTATLYTACGIALIWIIRTLLFKRFRQIAFLGIFLLGMGVFQWGKASYRYLIAAHPAEGTLNQATALQYAFRYHLEHPEPHTTLLQEYLRGFERIGDSSLGRVVRWTPAKVPFWNGESYRPLFYFAIPFFIWPDRPPRDIWHRFGKKYRYLAPADEYTSVGFNYFSEAYMNFGYLGLGLATLLLALLMVVVETWALHGSGRCQTLCFALLVTQFLIPNDTVSLLTGVIAFVLTLGTLKVLAQYFRNPRRFQPHHLALFLFCFMVFFA